MKLISLQLVTQASVLAIALSAPGHAYDRDTAAFSKQQFQAKLEYCKTCHGLSGQGYRGYFAMPRLAGQQPKYLENQLRAFIEGRRPNSIMSNAARALSPSVVAALANHFKDLNPKPLGGAPQELVGTGKKIFQEGIPEANVAACSACHGSEAKGLDEIPRLAGQLFPYTVKTLTNWNKERGQGAAKDDISAIMAPTAHNLTERQIAAIAAYLSSLN
jgi:cytochrome c553